MLVTRVLGSYCASSNTGVAIKSLTVARCIKYQSRYSPHVSNSSSFSSIAAEEKTNQSGESDISSPRDSRYSFIWDMTGKKASL